MGKKRAPRRRVVGTDSMEVPGVIEPITDEQLAKRGLAPDPEPKAPSEQELASRKLQSALDLMEDNELTLVRLRLEHPGASIVRLRELAEQEPEPPQDWDPRFFRKLTEEEQRRRFPRE